MFILSAFQAVKQRQIVIHLARIFRPELAKIINNDDALYERLVADMGATGTKFQKWWDDMATKYQWESAENGNWEIDFNTCDIYLVY